MSKCHIVGNHMLGLIFKRVGHSLLVFCWDACNEHHSNCLMNIKEILAFFLLQETYVVSTHWKLLTEMLPMSTTTDD